MHRISVLFLTALCLVAALSSCHKTRMMPAGPKISSHLRFMLGEEGTFTIINTSGALPVDIDFGDGETVSGKTNGSFKHTYQNPGDYTIVANVNGDELSKKVRVYALPALSREMPKLASEPYDRVLVMAHRAHSTDPTIPENSVAAVEECIRLGVDIVETDTHLTSDGVVVICHDQTIDRTTNGEGDITKMTLEKIRQYRLLDRKGHVTGEVMPTLEEFLKAARGKIYVNLDYSPRTASTEAVMSIVQKLDMMEGVLFYCNSEEKVKECFTCNPAAQVYPWATQYKPAVGKGHYFVQYNEDTTDRSALDQGMVCTVNMATLSDPTQSENDGSAYRLDKEEVDKVLAGFPTIRVLHTDVPAELISYLKEKGLR